MKEGQIGEEAEALPTESPFARDKYGLDLDEFKGKTGKPPHNWHRTLRQSEVIIIDEMRTWLELHYDDVHRRRWLRRHAEEQKRMPARKGAHHVFASVAQAYRKKLNQSMRLPDSVTHTHTHLAMPRGRSLVG